MRGGWGRATVRIASAAGKMKHFKSTKIDESSKNFGLAHMPICNRAKKQLA